jgi:purine-nucleoside phosphorylase
VTDREAPIGLHKHFDAPSVFLPENLLRQARRQKALPEATVPSVCVLDPDGDIVAYLEQASAARGSPTWACYHTPMHLFTQGGNSYGLIGNAVGASFAVLVAEELFASGCELLISMTSAGQITPVRQPPYFLLIEKALRDEGTSYHYRPPADYSHLDPRLLASLRQCRTLTGPDLLFGSTWTTDAPFRETQAAIAYARSEGICGVEMEAAALYAFSEATHHPVICLAHITNQLGNVDNDFEKGTAQGSPAALAVIDWVARCWLANQSHASRSGARPARIPGNSTPGDAPTAR